MPEKRECKLTNHITAKQIWNDMIGLNILANHRLVIDSTFLAVCNSFVMEMFNACLEKSLEKRKMHSDVFLCIDDLNSISYTSTRTGYLILLDLKSESVWASLGPGQSAYLRFIGE